MTGIRFEPEAQKVYPVDQSIDIRMGFELVHGYCPECKNLIVLMRYGEYKWVEDEGEVINIQKEEILYPRSVARSIDDTIPNQYRKAFNEANSVLAFSPKASAALSRRLLQTLLREEYKIKPGSLDTEITDFIQLKDIPIEISGAIDAIRNIGNFAAHPLKFTNTGEIVDVEPGEAEWLLEVLEALFDFTFIQPKRIQERKDKLNKKLSALGKPPMKG